MAAADYPPSLNSLPDQMAGHSGLLVGGQGEVGQVVEGTLHGPGPDQRNNVFAKQSDELLKEEVTKKCHFQVGRTKSENPLILPFTTHYSQSYFVGISRKKFQKSNNLLSPA